jgi:hypothetical protein
MAAAHKALAASHFNLLTMLAPDGRVKRFRTKTVTERFLAAPSAILHIPIEDASTADLLRWTVKTLAGLVAALGHFVRCHGALAAIRRVLLVVLSAWHHPIPWAGTVRDVTALGHNIRVFTYPYIGNQSYSCYQDKPPGLPVGWGAVFLNAQSEVFDSAAPASAALLNLGGCAACLRCPATGDSVNPSIRHHPVNPKEEASVQRNV